MDTVVENVQRRGVGVFPYIYRPQGVQDKYDTLDTRTRAIADRVVADMLCLPFYIYLSLVKFLLFGGSRP